MNKLIAILTAALLSNVALAADTRQTADGNASNASFASLDRNADSRISRTEAGMNRALSDAFAYVDTDGDGFINKAEYLSSETRQDRS